MKESTQKNFGDDFVQTASSSAVRARISQKLESNVQKKKKRCVQKTLKKKVKSYNLTRNFTHINYTHWRGEFHYIHTQVRNKFLDFFVFE